MRGFTLMELLVVMGITMMLSASAIGYSRGGEDVLNVQISAQKILSDVNQVVSYSLSSPGRRSDPNKRYCGFGMHLTSGSRTYDIFGDVPSGSSCKNSNDITKDKRFDASDEKLYVPAPTLKHSVIDSVKLIPSGTVINDIVFVPPDPTLYVNGATTTDKIEIVVRSERNETRSVCVNPIGQTFSKTGLSC